MTSTRPQSPSPCSLGHTRKGKEYEDSGTVIIL